MNLIFLEAAPLTFDLCIHAAGGLGEFRTYVMVEVFPEYNHI